MFSTEYKAGDTLLGRFHITEVIKTGGFGIVYICHDLRSKDSSERVALKSFKDEFFQNENVVRSFYHEAEVWIKLGLHPNIVTALSVLPIKEKPHVIMEYVDGGDLRQWINDRVINIRMFFDFSIQFCRGMIHANSVDLGGGRRGIVHRDIKPSNILMTSNGILKITDFGLIKALGLSTLLEAGTPEYMSPEQFQTMDVDQRSDIYSFGVVLYELFTGQNPFPRPPDPESRFPHYEHCHQNILPEFPPPGKTMVEALTEASIPSTVIKRIKGIILKCLEKQPENRYKTFDELKNELEDACPDYIRTQISHYREASVDDLSSDSRRAVLEFWGSAFITLGRYREAVQYFDNILKTDDRSVSAWASKAIALAMSGRPEDSLEYIEKALRLEPRNSYAWAIKGDCLARLGRYEEASGCFRKAIDLDPRVTVAWVGCGECLSRLGRHREALRCLDRAMDLEPGEPVVWRTKARILERLGKHEEALKHYDRAIELNPRSAAAWTDKGECLSRLGKINEALECYDNARKIERSGKPKDGEK